MPRKARMMHFPGAIYHTILRGNNRQNIFFSKEDRYHLYSLFEEGILRFGYRIHAFCLMTNHIHLLIEIADIPLEKIMQNLAFRYAQWSNKKMNRVGHLFQGRYKAILVQNQNYLIDLCRYIHLNPLKANLVENLADYLWSSHRTYVGKEQLSWVTTEYILSLINKIFNGTINYSIFIENFSNETDRKQIFYMSEKEECVITDDIVLKYQFSSDHRSIRLELNTIIDIVCEIMKIERSQIFSKSMRHIDSKARTLISIFTQRFSSISLRELGILFNRDASTISHAIYRWQIKFQKNKKNMEIYNIIQETLLKVSKSQA